MTTKTKRYRLNADKTFVEVKGYKGDAKDPCATCAWKDYNAQHSKEDCKLHCLRIKNKKGPEDYSDEVEE